MSIPPDLSQRLHKTLLRCAPFASDQALAAVFVDERISSDNRPRADYTNSPVAYQMSDYLTLL